MEKRRDTVLDRQGRPISAASVRVVSYPGGALATIYSDDGVSQTPNPLYTDDDGVFEYYAADGAYSWIVTTNTDTKTINDIRHGISGGSGVDETAFSTYTPTVSVNSGTITSAIQVARYKLVGKILHLHAVIDFTVTSGAPTSLRVTYPNAAQGSAAGVVGQTGLVVNGTPETGYFTEGSANYLSVARFGGGAFSGSCSLFGSFVLEIA